MGHLLCIIMSKNFGKKFRESAVRRKLKYWFSKKIQNQILDLFAKFKETGNAHNRERSYWHG